MAITRIKDGNAGGVGGSYLRYAAGFDTSDIPTAPISPPSSPNEGDVLIGLFSNDYTVNIRAIMYWEYDGTTWVQIGEVEYNTVHITDDVAGSLDYDTPPTAPVNYTGNESITYVPLDTLHEEYENGYVEWVCDGATWTFKLMRIYTSTQIYH